MINLFQKPGRFSHWLAKRKINNSSFKLNFTFPYASDFQIKKKQIIGNLQSGILIENNDVLIPWLFPQGFLDRYSEKTLYQGDRTIFYLGEQNIFSGLKLHLEVLCWAGQYNRPFSRISSNLGQNTEGFELMESIEKHLMSVFGEPDIKKMDPYWDNKAGNISWNLGKVIISLSGFDMHCLRYSFDIYLVNDPNDDLNQKEIEEIKIKYGLSDEDLGK
jgi:hypothetical protein